MSTFTIISVTKAGQTPFREEKLRVTRRFFQAKLKEYDLIRQEIMDLKQELDHESEVHDTIDCS